MILWRCLSFIFFQDLHSSRVRRQPTQYPVLPSNLQMSIHGDLTLMDGAKKGGGKSRSDENGLRRLSHGIAACRKVIVLIKTIDCRGRSRCTSRCTSRCSPRASPRCIHLRASAATSPLLAARFFNHPFSL